MVVICQRFFYFNILMFVINFFFFDDQGLFMFYIIFSMCTSGVYQFQFDALSSCFSLAFLCSVSVK